MTNISSLERARRRPDHGSRRMIREIAEHMFSRVAGSPLVAGNQLTLLRNAEENYPAWLDAIRSARSTIHFESYIMHEDEKGSEFADALIEKANEGVRVRLIYDWMGGFGKTSKKFWRRLGAAGVEVRCYNPPQIGHPFGWLSRDHRKMLAVDGRIGFVTGLCVGQMWVGDPAKGIEPWRDTGVKILGPAVADVEQAFAQVWARMGAPIPAGELPAREEIPEAGETSLRVIASIPGGTSVYRLDQLIAAGARRTLWLTDAYFAGLPSYVQGLRAAAMDGVDVRLLVPGASDINVISSISRAVYHSLLEAGVRVFEWNGPMIHAKTAVADGRWSRVGSTNLNIASWLSNCELDVVTEDVEFSQQVARMYEEDLKHATEVMLGRRGKILAPDRPALKRPRVKGGNAGSINRAAAGALGVGQAIGVAFGSTRVLGPAETGLLRIVALALIAVSLIGIFFPRAVMVPLAIICLWLAITLLIKTHKLRASASMETEKPGRQVNSA